MNTVSKVLQKWATSNFLSSTMNQRKGNWWKKLLTDYKSNDHCICDVWKCCLKRIVDKSSYYTSLSYDNNCESKHFSLVHNTYLLIHQQSHKTLQLLIYLWCVIFPSRLRDNLQSYLIIMIINLRLPLWRPFCC